MRNKVLVASMVIAILGISGCASKREKVEMEVMQAFSDSYKIQVFTQANQGGYACDMIYPGIAMMAVKGGFTGNAYVAPHTMPVFVEYAKLCKNWR